MLRSQIIAGVGEIIEAVKTSELISSLRRGSNKESPASLLRALRSYAVTASSFSPAARAVIDVFNLERIEDADFWVKLLSDSDDILMIRSRLSFMERELPAILTLLSQETVLEKDGADNQDVELLQIRLIEESGSFSTVKRVIEALAACQELYDSLAILEDEVSTPLAIAAVDSGSDKAFDLFGAAKVMAEFRKLILSMWDLVVFHRERKFGKQLDVIAAALPILERIKKLEDSEKIGREQAQIIRSGIIDGAKKFLHAGITTDDIESQVTANSRALLAPEPKLLSAPNSGTRSSGDSPPISGRHDGHVPSAGTAQRTDGGDLSESDIQRIARAMNEFRGDSSRKLGDVDDKDANSQVE